MGLNLAFSSNDQGRSLRGAAFFCVLTFMNSRVH
jgi:hypothetical protein